MAIGMRGRALPSIARGAIAAWLAGTEAPVVPPVGAAHGVFVTLRGPGGALRGCIGSLEPATADVVQETQRSAVLAASRDPRFPALSADELPGVTLEVSVLGVAEPIVSAGELDAARYGVIVRGASGRRGVLLPEVPGVTDVATQLRVAREKAGIPDTEPVEVSRFCVEKYSE